MNDYNLHQVVIGFGVLRGGATTYYFCSLDTYVEQNKVSRLRRKSLPPFHSDKKDSDGAGDYYHPPPDSLIAAYASSVA